VPGRSTRSLVVIMDRTHEAQIREIDRHIPRERLGLKAFVGFIVLPVLAAAVWWADRAGEEAFQMSGTITQIRTEVADTIPPLRTIAIVQLPDGTSVRCQYILSSSVGDRVTLSGARSRLLGRRLITC
jgi:hypothetical protein